MLKGAGCLLLLGAAGAVQLNLMGEHRRELELLAGLEADLERMAETRRQWWPSSATPPRAWSAAGQRSAGSGGRRRSSPRPSAFPPQRWPYFY